MHTISLFFTCPETQLTYNQPKIFTKLNLHQTGQLSSECCWLLWTAVQIYHVHLHKPAYAHKSNHLISPRSSKLWH